MTTPEGASRVEADAAAVPTHHTRHHPADLNEGVVRGELRRSTVVAAALTAAVTVGGVIWFAVAIGGVR